MLLFFTVFTEALIGAELLDSLDSAGPYTVFVVSNDGARKLGTNEVDSNVNSTIEGNQKTQVMFARLRKREDPSTINGHICR